MHCVLLYICIYIFVVAFWKEMITAKKSIKFSSDTCCLHHLIGTDRHVTIRSFSRGRLYAKTTFQFQSEEIGINYTKKMANSFLKTTHSKRVTHASRPTFLSSCKFDLNFKGWRNHESGKIFVEFHGSGSFVFLLAVMCVSLTVSIFS